MDHPNNEPRQYLKRFFIKSTNYPRVHFLERHGHDCVIESKYGFMNCSNGRDSDYLINNQDTITIRSISFHDCFYRLKENDQILAAGSFVPVGLNYQAEISLLSALQDVSGKLVYIEIYNPTKVIAISDSFRVEYGLAPFNQSYMKSEEEKNGLHSVSSIMDSYQNISSIMDSCQDTLLLASKEITRLKSLLLEKDLEIARLVELINKK